MMFKPVVSTCCFNLLFQSLLNIEDVQISRKGAENRRVALVMSGADLRKTPS
jgi:hypothetical protein